jgi:hypothetical protein
MPLHRPGFIEPCLPTASRIVTGPEWAFEIIHLPAQRQARVRFHTRGGFFRSLYCIAGIGSLQIRVPVLIAHSDKGLSSCFRAFA